MRETSRTRALAVYDFCAGTDSRAYEHFGVHRAGRGQYVFRLFAPLARSVTVIGDFLPAGEWPMARGADGVWTATVTPSLLPEGMAYAYRIDDERYIADPFARGGLADDGASATVCTESAHRWQDELWMSSRVARQPRQGDRPINVYRVHLSSFATRHGQSCTSADAYLNYRELGDLLARYVADMGYTHIRLMPLTEHLDPLRCAQTAVGYFAPTCRHGSPDDLRAMIDRLHRAGIGVIMDLPFAECKAEIPQVAAGGRFDLTVPETRSYQLSVTAFWLRAFHLDGVCPLGLSSGIASDGDGFSDWCAAVRSICSDALLIAEDAVDWNEHVDLVIHSRADEDIRRAVGVREEQWPSLYDRLTLTLREITEFGRGVLLPPDRHLFDSERGSLPPYGGYVRHFAVARLILAYRMAHPGKKQAFMGEELGQRRPWDGSAPPDWYLRELPMYEEFWQYVRRLNHFYRTEPRLWESEQAELLQTKSTAVILLSRADRMGRRLLAAMNFSDVSKTVCLDATPWGNGLQLLFRSDGRNTQTDRASEQDWTVRDGRLEITLPPLTAFFLEPRVDRPRPIRQFILTSDEFQKNGG